MGSCVCKRSAKSAVKSITRIKTPPAAPSGFFRAKRARTVHVPARGRAPAGTAISAGLIAIADPRVEDPVEHVHEQVREDDDDGDEHYWVLCDGVGAPEDRLDHEPRVARQDEEGVRGHDCRDDE